MKEWGGPGKYKEEEVGKKNWGSQMKKVNRSMRRCNVKQREG